MNVTSLTGNGLKDWLIQRFTAIYFMVYCLFVLAYLVVTPPLNYMQWYLLFHNTWFTVASIIALFALTLHTWIGVWTVITDYIKATAIRVLVQFLVMLWLVGQLIWGLMIMWGR